MFPLLLMGALGLGIAYYLYNNNDSGGIGGGSSAGSGSSWLFGDEGIGGIGGAATNSDRAMSPAAASAGAGARSASATGSAGVGYAGESSGISSVINSSYVADVKKNATVQNYQPLSSSDIDYINSQLLNVYGEGSAYNFAKVQNNATMAATIQNTGINNAGKSLLSIVNADNSYQVYDSRGQIVSSGSAGAFQGSVLLNTGIKSGGSGGSSSSSGGGSSSGAGSSKKAASVSGGSLSSVNITADKASAARSSSCVKTGTITGKVGVSSGSSSSSSSSKKGWSTTASGLSVH